ncbi:MAG: glycyl-radical enzyme activating protein [Cyclobacteriaceae bacterium]|nr:glycyl-radical enzyme activating protein [Cyclobacteriaceae bacterium]
MIFDIQRYSIHDGAGIAQSCFLEGCNLRCAWCSNPESQSRVPSLFFNARQCKGFGECATAMPDVISMVDGKAYIARTLLQGAELLQNVCPSRALTVSGEEKSVEALLVEIEKDRPFFGRDGGVTISGGEPFLQQELLHEVLPALKASGINIAVETCLHVSWDYIKPHLNHIDVFLADLKHLDAEKFRMYTGGDVDRVIENFRKLNESGATTIARIPVIPGFNNSFVELSAMVDFICGLSNIHEVNFIPFHKLGVEKYAMLGMAYTFPFSDSIEETDLQEIQNYARIKGLKTKIGG